MLKCSTSKALPSVIAGDGEKGSGLGFGAMGITAFYGDPIPDEDAMKILKAVYDKGCRHFDTAEVYKTGNPFEHSEDDSTYNETVLGKFFETVPRETYTVATKFMPQVHECKNDYDTVKRALTASLRRLDLECVDLYYSHRVPSLEGALEFARSCMKLKEEGLIKGIGFSEISAAWLRKVNSEVCPVDAIQQEWSLVTRNLEDEIVPTCKELGIAVVAYSPLARSLLSSKLEAMPSDWRNTLPRFQGDNLEKNKVLVADIVESMAAKYRCTPAQLSLAWLFKRAQQMGVTVVPIPGTTKLNHALSNVEAAKIDISDEDDMKTLDELSEKVAGARGDDHYISWGFESQK